MIDEIVRKIYEENQRYRECALRLLYIWMYIVLQRSGGKTGEAKSH